MAVPHTSRRARASAYALLLACSCATELQEPIDTQGFATTTGGSSGAGGSEAGSAGVGGGETGGHGGTAAGGGASGSAGSSNESGTGGGGADGAGSGGSGGGGAGGGGAGGTTGGGGAAGTTSGGSAGSGGTAGQGGGGNGGSGGTAPMPNPCEKNKLKIVSATASSTENDTFPASKAFDGDAGTRWASAMSEPQWIYFDLGEVAHVSRVLISWEAAYATNYKIEIAQASGGPWTSMFQENAGNGGMDDLTNVTARNGRYVRLYGNTRATAYGFSVYEFSAYGDLDETCK